MNTLHELKFQPSDTLEHRAFEGVVHDFVAHEASKPLSDATSIFVSYDEASRSWSVRFETQAALDAFRARWQARRSGQDHTSRPDPTAGVPLGLLANPQFVA